VRCWAPAVSGVLREGRDRRRPHRGGITGQVRCPSRRLDCSDLRRTCSTETPPEPARSRRPSDIPTVLVSIHRFAGRGGSRLLASYHSGMLTVGLISRMALAWPGVEPRDAIPIRKPGQRQRRGSASVPLSTAPRLSGSALWPHRMGPRPAKPRLPARRHASTPSCLAAC
jgi:hypothetical protein